MKKLLSVLLAAALLVAAIPFAVTASPVISTLSRTGEVSIQGTKMDFAFDFRALTVGSNTSYSQELSFLSSLLSIDEYASSPAATDNAMYKVNLYDTDESLLQQVGFSDVRRVSLAAELPADAIDADDVLNFAMARRTLTVESKEYVVYAFVMQGSDGSGSQWASNFDLGADTEDYYEQTGEHPEWINKQNHKGFDIAANRVKAYLYDYMAEFAAEDRGKAVSVLTTGHSRGAAVANLLGKTFEDDRHVRSYTYTFATPATTTDIHVGDYDTIFNIINKDDLVPELPMYSLGFTRYGTDYKASVADDYSEAYHALFGIAYAGSSSEGVDAGDPEAMGCLASSREEFYRFEEPLYYVMTEIMDPVPLDVWMTANRFDPTVKLVGDPFYNADEECEMQAARVCPAVFMTAVTNMVTAMMKMMDPTLGMGDQIRLFTDMLAQGAFLGTIANGSPEGEDSKYQTAYMYVVNSMSSRLTGHVPTVYAFLASVMTVCEKEVAVKTPVDGQTYKVTLGGRSAGSLTFTAAGKGFKLNNNLGYVTLKNGRIVYTDAADATVWTYSKGLLSTKTVQKGWFGVPVTTVWYLNTAGDQLAATTCALKAVASLTQTVRMSEHRYGRYIDDGKQHYQTCVYCGSIKKGDHDYGGGKHCDLCGATDPSYVTVNVKAVNTTRTVRTGLFRTKKVETTTIQPVTENIAIRRIEYSLENNRNWKEGNVLEGRPDVFFVRLTATNGNIYLFCLNHGQVLPAN